VNKIRLFHFYSNSRKGLKEWLSSTPKLKISLFCDNELVGNAECSLQDFNNPIVVKKEYYEMFSGVEIKTAYLKAMVGIVEGGLENVSNIKLKAHRGIFVPPEDYTYCEPLPEEWLDILPNLNDYRRNLKENYGIETQTHTQSRSLNVSRMFTGGITPKTPKTPKTNHSFRHPPRAIHRALSRSVSVGRRRP
jgi:hypothetical protein